MLILGVRQITGTTHGRRPPRGGWESPLRPRRRTAGPPVLDDDLEMTG
jgi:hypothetical protein